MLRSSGIRFASAGNALSRARSRTNACGPRGNTAWRTIASGAKATRAPARRARQPSQHVLPQLLAVRRHEPALLEAADPLEQARRTNRFAVRNRPVSSRTQTVRSNGPGGRSGRTTPWTRSASSSAATPRASQSGSGKQSASVKATSGAVAAAHALVARRGRSRPRRVVDDLDHELRRAPLRVEGGERPRQRRRGVPRRDHDDYARRHRTSAGAASRMRNGSTGVR